MRASASLTHEGPLVTGAHAEDPSVCICRSHGGCRGHVRGIIYGTGFGVQPVTNPSKTQASFELDAAGVARLARCQAS